MNTYVVAVIVVLLILAFAGAPEVTPHSYGWVPSSYAGAVAVVLIILLLLGVI